MRILTFFEGSYNFSAVHASDTVNDYWFDWEQPGRTRSTNPPPPTTGREDDIVSVTSSEAAPVMLLEHWRFCGCPSPRDTPLCSAEVSESGEGEASREDEVGEQSSAPNNANPPEVPAVVQEEWVPENTVPQVVPDHIIEEWVQTTTENDDNAMETEEAVNADDTDIAVVSSASSGSGEEEGEAEEEGVGQESGEEEGSVEEEEEFDEEVQAEWVRNLYLLHGRDLHGGELIMDDFGQHIMDQGGDSLERAENYLRRSFWYNPLQQESPRPPLGTGSGIMGESTYWFSEL